MAIFGVVCIAVVCYAGLVFAQTDIRRPPTITGSPNRDVVFRLHDDVTLECNADGVPKVNYTWTYNGVPLHNQSSENGTLTLVRATQLNEGFYQCLAENRHGIAVSNPSHLRLAFLKVSTNESFHVQERIVEERKPFHIPAPAHNHSSYPKPIYSWRRVRNTSDVVGVEIHASNKIQIADNGDLHFANAEPRDNLGGKLYSFNIHNPFLNDSLGISYTNVTVIQNASDLVQFAPTLGFATESPIVALRGENVSIRCFFYGFPEPSITWERSGSTLTSGRYTFQNFLTGITINHVTDNDEGEYICNGTNDMGWENHTIQIKVEAAPRFKDEADAIRDVNVTEGGSHAFSCDTNAKPEAEIVWYMNGKPIDAAYPPKRFTFSNGKKRLTISNVCRDCNDPDRQTDLMVIQCNASNVHGHAFRSGYLNVLKKTTVLFSGETDVSVNLDEERRFQFTCNATSDPSTPPSFQWYKLENDFPVQVRDDPPALTVENGTLTIHFVPNMTQDWTKYEGEYRCIARNGYSNDVQTVKLKVDRPPINHQSRGDLWWIFLVIGIACFVLVGVGICVAYLVYRRRNQNRGHFDINAEDL